MKRGEEGFKHVSTEIRYRKIAPKHLCRNPPSNDSSSSSSSSAPSCPAGQIRDSNGTCSTCSAPQVFNFAIGQCAQKQDCTFPEKYSSYDNACHPNPNNCANGASTNPLTGVKCDNPPTVPPPTCPSGWSLMPDNTCLKSTDTASRLATDGAYALSSSWELTEFN